MTQRLRNVRELRDEGFTLIELLIVIIILGILGGLAVFGVSTFKKDSVVAACKADMKTVSVAIEAFGAKTGAYPTGADSTARYALLTAVPAGAISGYLKAAPTSTDYTVAIADDNGTVTGTKSAANGGGPC